MMLAGGQSLLMPTCPSLLSCDSLKIVFLDGGSLPAKRVSAWSWKTHSAPHWCALSLLICKMGTIKSHLCCPPQDHCCEDQATWYVWKRGKMAKSSTHKSHADFADVLPFYSNLGTNSLLKFYFYTFVFPLNASDSLGNQLAFTSMYTSIKVYMELKWKLTCIYHSYVDICMYTHT